MAGRRLAIVEWTLIAVGLVLPAALTRTAYANYAEHVAVQMMLLGLYSMSWDFLNGYVGLFSFGHAAFFGTGAYASAIVIVHGGVTSVPAIFAVALASTALIGGIVGFLSSRVGRVAVFLVTFACAEVIYLVVHADPRGLTNGDNGVPGVVARPFLGLDLTGRLSFYYTALAVIVLSYIVLGRIARSQFGEVLLAIRDNETRVKFSGYRVEDYKTAAFVLSALFAGLAGALTAFHERIASPEACAWPMSGDAVLYAILGGSGTLVGPIVGTIAVVLAREVMSDLLRSWLIVIGFIYIALVFFLPSGIVPVLLGSSVGRPFQGRLRGKENTA
jgi:branched-chain amino acid transport system permease protein